MNINRKAILKLLVILFAITAGVGILSKIVSRNSMTLGEYAQKHPELAFQESEEAPTAEADADRDAQTSDAQNTSDFALEADGDRGSDAQGMADSSSETEETDGDGADPGASAESSAPAETPTPEEIRPEITVLPGYAANKEQFADISDGSRVTVAEDFYYEPLSPALIDYITGKSYPAADALETADGSKEPAITCGELRYVHIRHINFDGEDVAGELICNESIAGDLTEIFYELYRNDYRLESVRLVDEFEGDDVLSMEADNTSCFNYRLVAGSTTLSRHALGLAVDVNPFYNPYVTFNGDGSENVSPAAAAPYADRSLSFPYKIDETDLCYRLFIEHGFTWGGNWNSSRDYQHFQKSAK